MWKKQQSELFGDSDNEDGCDFKTNTNYARHYDEFRKKEILSHLKNISDESSSSDDASTDEELVNPEFDKEFLKSLAFLKNKDPAKYEKIPKFFENVKTVEETIKEKQQYKSKKPVTVADYQRERLIKTDGRMTDDEEDVQQDESLSYAKEQEKIKNDLKNALQESSDDEDSNKLFQVKEKAKEELVKEDEDYLKWLAGQKKEVKLGEDSKALMPLKDFWSSKTLPKADQFLRDYIVNKRYMDETNTATYEDVVGLSEDEQEVEQQNEFETKYNFRFEEPDNEFIKRFPRTIEDTVRVDSNTRKDKRKERQERKAQEKEVKMKDLRELQNIRKREIEQKLILLKEVAGNDELLLQEDDLNTDFDPAEHDRRMGAMFNNEYYGIDEGDQKPEFPDIDDELQIENWDNFDKNKFPNSPANDEDDEGQHCEDDDFNMDCDFDPAMEKKKKLQDELIEMSKGRKRKKKISKLAEIIKKEKPTFDPATEKTYEEYLDEYYKLDYEDIIGDQPCRFRYTDCVANDFGLTVEEILLASNKELNQWASLKKTMQNRPQNVEWNDVEKYNRRRNNVALKQKIFTSMYGEPESDDGEQSNDDQNSVKIVKPKPDSTQGKSKPGPSQVKPKLGSSQVKSKPGSSQVKSKVGSSQDKAKPVAAQEKLKPESAQSKLKLEASPDKPKLEASQDEQKPVAPQVKPATNGKNKQKKKANTGNQPKVTSAPVVSNKNAKTLGPVVTAFKTRGHVKGSNPQVANGKSSNQQQAGANKRKFNEFGSKTTPNNSKKMKFNKSITKPAPSNELSENRLKAFGINPKKFKNKIKYANNNQQQGAQQHQKKKFQKNSKNVA